MDMEHTQVLMKWAMHAIFQSYDLEQANPKQHIPINCYSLAPGKLRTLFW